MYWAEEVMLTNLPKNTDFLESRYLMSVGIFVAHKIIQADEVHIGWSLQL